MTGKVDRVPLGNQKNNVIKTNLSTDLTVAELIAALNAGVYADVTNNDSTVTGYQGASPVGTKMTKAVYDEFLSASGTTTGTSSALVLAQSGFNLVDGAVVRFKAHVDVSTGATLNVASTGAKTLVDHSLQVMSGIKSTAWVTAVYNGTYYVVQSVQAYKIGDIKPTMRQNTDTDWLLCNGDIIVQATYPELYDVLIEAGFIPYISETTMVSISYTINGFREVNGYYVAVGQNSSNYPIIIYSNGSSWTALQINSSYTGYLCDIAYGNGYFVAVGCRTDVNYPYAYYCATINGSWAPQVLYSGSGSAAKIIYDGTRFIALCSDGSNRPYLRYANTPSSWTYQTITSRSSCFGYDLIHAGGYYVVVGYSTTTYYTYIWYCATYNGSYTEKQITATTYLISYSLIHDGTRFIITAYNANLAAKVYLYYATTPGGTWTLKEITTSVTVQMTPKLYYLNSEYILTVSSVDYTAILVTDDITGTWKTYKFASHILQILGAEVLDSVVYLMGYYSNYDNGYPKTFGYHPDWVQLPNIDGVEYNCIKAL